MGHEELARASSDTDEDCTHSVTWGLVRMTRTRVYCKAAPAAVGDSIRPVSRRRDGCCTLTTEEMTRRVPGRDVGHESGVVSTTDDAWSMDCPSMRHT